MLAIQAAPAPAANPATASHTSRALRSNRIALVPYAPLLVQTGELLGFTALATLARSCGRLG